ncbi:hypothetical protein [Nonomuraea sp. B5E05]|uniref:hypothetical protein n=1 Tax=Nonomuraea sp. B5E05 TaxID=3153569 RepID=UPI0032619629
MDEMPMMAMAGLTLSLLVAGPGRRWSRLQAAGGRELGRHGQRRGIDQSGEVARGFEQAGAQVKGVYDGMGGGGGGQRQSAGGEAR